MSCSMLFAVKLKLFILIVLINSEREERENIPICIMFLWSVDLQSLIKSFVLYIFLKDYASIIY